MYHSIFIGSKNTWDDWHLIPSTRPVFAQPEQKIKTVDIPGGNGVLDLSQALTGYPIYNNREGDLEFNVVNEVTNPWFRPWYDLYSEIANYLSGNRFRIVLEDDQEYYYEGMMTLKEWKSEKSWSKIQMHYNLDPFKWYGRTTTEDWSWDPFNFFTGLITINDYRNIPIRHTSEGIALTPNDIGYAPICPTFTIATSGGATGASVRIVDLVTGKDITRNIPEGTSQNADLVFTGHNTRLYIATRGTGVTGTASVDFRQGRL